MARIPLSPSATIADIVQGLDDPVEYVRGVLGNLMACQKQTEGDPVQVRIGVKGRGKWPHYRVEPEGTYFNQAAHDLFSPALEGFSQLARQSRGLPLRSSIKNRPGEMLGVFHGRSHKPLLHEDPAVLEAIILENSWSTKESTLEEVRELLGELRGFKRDRK